MNMNEHKSLPGGEAEPGRREEGGSPQMDDINIPLVAVVVACFVALVTVGIIALQAAYFHYQAGERARKTLAQEDVHAELGAILAGQRQELQRGPSERRLAAAGVATATGAATHMPRDTKPIEEAMRVVSREYQGRRTP
jgi:hypothetical protein